MMRMGWSRKQVVQREMPMLSSALVQSGLFEVFKLWFVNDSLEA